VHHVSRPIVFFRQPQNRLVGHRIVHADGEQLVVGAEPFQRGVRLGGDLRPDVGPAGARVFIDGAGGFYFLVGDLSMRA
jgi:hypothetical protein